MISIWVVAIVSVPWVSTGISIWARFCDLSWFSISRPLAIVSPVSVWSVVSMISIWVVAIVSVPSISIGTGISISSWFSISRSFSIPVSVSVWSVVSTISIVSIPWISFSIRIWSGLDLLLATDGGKAEKCQSNQ